MRGLTRWPLPAFMAWAGTWAAFFLMRREWPGAPLWQALAACSVLGVLLSAMGEGFWRRALIALGFPVSVLLLGAGDLPAWAWLLPLAVLLALYPISAWRDAPVFPTPPDALNTLPEHASLEPDAHVLDAGSGLGDGLIALRQAYPLAQLAGIERSAALVALSRRRCRKHGVQADIHQGDLWQADWSGFDLVYLFQRPESMPRALDKARTELRPGAWLVSLEFEVRGVPPTAQMTTPDGRPVWVYRAPLAAAADSAH